MTILWAGLLKTTMYGVDAQRSNDFRLGKLNIQYSSFPHSHTHLCLSRDPRALLTMGMHSIGWLYTNCIGVLLSMAVSQCSTTWHSTWHCEHR